MKSVYLASPYTDESFRVEEERFIDVTSIAGHLLEKHHVSMFLPITQSHLLRKYNPNLLGTFEAWRDIDLDQIDRQDEVWVVMLKGWKESKGVSAEINYALQKKKPIKYIDPITMEIL